MLHRFSRTELVLGPENMHRLHNAHIAIFGIGGVGSFVAEGLARSGVGKLTLIDSDTISLTNLNRQIHALESTIGMKKVQAMRSRILEINPEAQVEIIDELYLPEKSELFLSNNHDYIVDAVDDMVAKVDLAIKATAANIPIISSMGTGKKIDPSKLQLADIYNTHTCPLAKRMRKAMKEARVKRLKVLFSTEVPREQFPINFIENASKEASPASTRKQPLGSVSFVPPVAGLMIASEVIRDLCELK